MLENTFSSWCKVSGIKKILFDFDDTFCKTVPVFIHFIDECIAFLADQLPELTMDEWRVRVEKSNNEAFELMGVNPRRWVVVINNATIGTCIDQKIRDEAIKILMKIYFTPPEIIPGVVEALEFISESNVSKAIVTHANVDWTKRKFEWLGMDRFFKWSDVYIIDENGHKTKETWAVAINYFRVKPENCAVVGDSPRADMLPAEELGVKVRILVRDPNALKWSIHNRVVSQDTIVIGNLKEMISF